MPNGGAVALKRPVKSFCQTMRPSTGVECREDPADPEREQPALVDDRSRLRSAPVRGRTRIDAVGSAISLTPERLARAQVQGARDFQLAPRG